MSRARSHVRIWAANAIRKSKYGLECGTSATIPIMDPELVSGKHAVTPPLELQVEPSRVVNVESLEMNTGALAHDLRNYLQIIDGCLDLLVDDHDMTEAARIDIGVMKKAVGGSLELAKALAHLRRDTCVKLEPLDLNKLIADSKPLFVATLSEKIGVDLIMTEAPWKIKASSLRIEQALINLAINARDAMPEGGRLIIKTENSILGDGFCQAHPKLKPGRYVLLSVSDTGTGMDQETAQRIFEPFFTTKEAGNGTGLGLSVVHGIVENHDGVIVCDSEPHAGTTFRVYFPAVNEVAATRHIEKSLSSSSKGATILAVDDEPDILAMISRQLGRGKYNLVTASGGKEALRLYQELKEQIGLVILDLVMPEMDGSQCLEALRSLNPDVKVLFCTGAVTQQSISQLAKAGASGILQKPFDLPQLCDKIHELMN